MYALLIEKHLYVVQRLSVELYVNIVILSQQPLFGWYFIFPVLVRIVFNEVCCLPAEAIEIFSETLKWKHMN